MNKDIAVIIQAREKSSRLNGKIFKKIGPFCMLELLIKEVSKINQINKIFIATSKKTNKMKILKIANKYNCRVFFGSEDNVFSRFFHICKKFKISSFVRLTADNPLIHHSEINKIIKFYKKNKFDYLSNLIELSYPEGYSIEIMRSKVLNKLNKKLNSLDKEHVTYSIVKKKFSFNIANYRLRQNYSKFRVTCDDKKDLKNLRLIFNSFKYQVPKLSELVKNKFFKISKEFKHNKSLHYRDKH